MGQHKSSWDYTYIWPENELSIEELRKIKDHISLAQGTCTWLEDQVRTVKKGTEVLTDERLRQVGRKHSTLEGSSDTSDKAKYNNNQLGSYPAL